MTAVPLVGLQMDSALATPGAQNFLPPTWPPPLDFPVSIDAQGNVLSRVGDDSWNLSPWAGRALSLSFGSTSRSRQHISPENGAIFRQVDAWWLWGPGAVRTAKTLLGRHDLFKVMFVVCSEAGIKATDLSRFPRVIEQLAPRLLRTRADAVIGYLHNLWLARDDLGFVLLDEAGIKLLSSLLRSEETTQTAYIPPRIWAYQVTRLRQCIDDYLAHRDQVEACFRFCLEAYAKNAGGSLMAAHEGMSTGQQPFNPVNSERPPSPDRQFYGPFRKTLEQFGIADLLDRWVNSSAHSGVKAFSTYLTLVSQAGLAHLLNFSLMRVSEGAALRANCHSVERDAVGEDIHMLGGITTKTIADDDARWIVSPSVSSTIEAMASVARLRLEAGKEHPDSNLTAEDIENPILQSWAYEPWSAVAPKPHRKDMPAYKQLLDMWPKLFDVEQLRITEEDYAIASRMTFGLDPEKFAVGKVWPLGWHQLRRTGAVNMLATGHVTDASLQYQLKHATRAMSRYYGQNYLHLQAHLDEDARGLYVREMYQSLAREFENLAGDRFVSPHGEKRKAQILNPISEKDHRGLVADAKAGRISYRETLLGGCAKLGAPCPLGGITNISGCMGHGELAPCADALLDREKVPTIVKLKDLLLERQGRVPPGSRAFLALQAQLESADRALNVLDAS